MRTHGPICYFLFSKIYIKYVFMMFIFSQELIRVCPKGICLWYVNVGLRNTRVVYNYDYWLSLHYMDMYLSIYISLLHCYIVLASAHVSNVLKWYDIPIIYIYIFPLEMGEVYQSRAPPRCRKITLRTCVALFVQYRYSTLYYLNIGT